MKKVIYVLISLLVVVSSLVLANREAKNVMAAKSTSQSPSVADREAVLKKWEASLDGITFKAWETSPEGVKVLAAAAKIKNHIRDSTTMEAMITSLFLPPGSRLGFGVMVRINDDDYILSFGSLKSPEFQQLKSLKVNDSITIRSHFVSHAPKYAFPIVTANYVERDGKIVYKRTLKQGGC